MPLSNIEILHQDDALLVINKPTLLLSVPGRAEDNRDCLVTRLQENGYPEARIVHRLDWETSGIIVLARDADSHRELSRQFHDRETEKAYTALCWGQPELDSGQHRPAAALRPADQAAPRGRLRAGQARA